MTSRPLTSDELTYIESTLEELRDHFHVWPTEPGNEWHLVNFAFYEGCGGDGGSGDILARAAPLALGNYLVRNLDCAWCMLADMNDQRYAITHPLLFEPVDLYGLDRHPMLDPDEHDDYTGLFCPGEGAHESIYALKRILNPGSG